MTLSKKIVSTLFSATIAYLLTSFVTWELNPTHWDKDSRMAATAIHLLCFTFTVLEDYFYGLNNYSNLE